jgi:hypothetical protein
MVIDSGETQILEGTLAESIEQLALGFAGLNLAAGDLVEQRFQLGRIHWCRGGKGSVLLPGSELDANIIDCAK